MTDSPKVSITVKAGSGHGDPWVVFHANSVDEAGYLIQDMLAKDVFTKVRQVSQQFAQGVSTEQAVNTVRETFPGATVTSDSQQLPESQGVPCGVCGGPTQFKSGTSRAGKPYKGHFCTSNRDHAPVWV